MNYVIHNATTNLDPQIETCRAHAHARPGCSPDCEECAIRLGVPAYVFADYEPERPMLTLAMLEEVYRELIAAAVLPELINGVPHFRT